MLNVQAIRPSDSIEKKEAIIQIAKMRSRQYFPVTDAVADININIDAEAEAEGQRSMKPTPMIHQAGGHSSTTQPMLRMLLHHKTSGEKDALASTSTYILKPIRIPLHIDHDKNTDSDLRGVREVAFYEAVQHALGGEDGDEDGDGDDDRDPGINDQLELQLQLQSQSQSQSSQSLQSRRRFRFTTHVHTGTEQEIQTLRKLSPFLPDYLGVVTFNSSSYLVLEDVTAESTTFTTCKNAYTLHNNSNNQKHKFQQPCVMDLKMGRKTYEPGVSSKEKIKSQTTKYPPQALFGFRIVGMNLYDPTHEESNVHGYRILDKKFGRSLHHESDLMDAFSTFFKLTITMNGSESESRSGSGSGSGCGDQQRIGVGDDDEDEDTTPNIRRLLIQHLLHDLSMLHQWFVQQNNEIAFYASSIIIVYEGDDRFLVDPKAYSLKLIDFAHVQHQHQHWDNQHQHQHQIKNVCTGNCDWNYIHGLDVLMRLFRSIVAS